MAGSIRISHNCIFIWCQMYLNSNRYKFRFSALFFGIAVALFLISLTQESLGSSELFVFAAIFLGFMLINAIYVRTVTNGFKKLLLSLGFVILAGLIASLMLWGYCKIYDAPLCTTRSFGVTLVGYFVF